MKKVNKNKQKDFQKERRFSIRWQLAIGVASGFFVIFVFYAMALIFLYRQMPLQTAIVNKWIGIITFVAMIAILVYSFVLATWIMRPIYTIEKTVEAFEEDPLTEVRAEEGYLNDEFQDLIKMLNRMIDRLQTFINAQQQFVSDVSHELRTPVAIVKGHMELLNRWGKDDPEVLNDSIQASLAETKRMELLISEMLNLTRADQIILEKVDAVTNVKGIVHRVFENFKLLYPDFLFMIDDDTTSDTVNARISQDHLEQIIIILADNAVKYSNERKEVHFALSNTAREVQIGVQDFGEGLSQENAVKVFDRFYRVDKARSRKKGGTGLGLSIAKRLVEAYGGSITLQSAEGSGSIFTIKLPMINK